MTSKVESKSLAGAAPVTAPDLQKYGRHLSSCNVNKQELWDEAQAALNQCEADEGTSIAAYEIAQKRTECTCGFTQALAGERESVPAGRIVEIVPGVFARLKRHAKTSFNECDPATCENKEHFFYELVESVPATPAPGFDDATEKRWQDAIYEVCKAAVGPKNDWQIDGGGCDSGDALDFTLCEIRQAIYFWQNKFEELSAPAAPVPSEQEKIDEVRAGYQQELFHLEGLVEQLKASLDQKSWEAGRDAAAQRLKEERESWEIDRRSHKAGTKEADFIDRRIMSLKVFEAQIRELAFPAARAASSEPTESTYIAGMMDAARIVRSRKGKYTLEQTANYLESLCTRAASSELTDADKVANRQRAVNLMDELALGDDLARVEIIAAILGIWGLRAASSERIIEELKRTAEEYNKSLAICEGDIRRLTAEAESFKKAANLLPSRTKGSDGKRLMQMCGRLPACAATK